MLRCKVDMAAPNKMRMVCPHDNIVRRRNDNYEVFDLDCICILVQSKRHCQRYCPFICTILPESQTKEPRNISVLFESSRSFSKVSWIRIAIEFIGSISTRFIYIPVVILHCYDHEFIVVRVDVNAYLLENTISCSDFFLKLCLGMTCALFILELFEHTFDEKN